MANTPIPITLISGYLGAGKTTLLNHILQAEHGKRIAVLVNDFGDINIDSELVVGVQGERTISLSNGCICCTISGDLLQALLELLASPDRPEYIVVEASGVSDPAAVATTFMLPDLNNLVYLDSIIALLDAEQFPTLDNADEILAMDQVGVADFVLINKVDLVEEAQLEELRAWVRDIVPNARILETSFARTPLELLLGAGRYDPEQLAGRDPHDVHVHAPEPPAHKGKHAFVLAPREHHSHADHSLVFTSWSFTSGEPFALKKLRRLLDELPASIYRAKGIVHLKEAPQRKATLQVAGTRVRLTLGEEWQDERPGTRMVFIGQKSFNAEQLEKDLLSCIDSADNKQTIGNVLEWMRSKPSS
ncbi:MAG: GTP-binding protein [Anaerolineales bacterium]|nr:GTP-binding protein [Anaerolineales bacterium]